MSTLIEFKHFGEDQGLGNLLGIQPYMQVADYASESAFYSKLKTYFAHAERNSCLGPKTVVVLPEYVGSWLVVADQPSGVLQAKTIEEAMIRLIAKNFSRFLKFILHNHGASDRIKYAVFRINAERAAQIYWSTFSRLAREHSVTIVAGSIVLPPFKITDTGPIVRDGKLYNTTLVFGREGMPDPQVLHKIYPTPQELPFTEPGTLEQLPVYLTPAGRMGVLNCADSWYGETYARLNGRVDFIVVPSFIEKDGEVSKPWNGKNISPAPPEFDPADFFNITYDEAWLKYALPSRVGLAGVKNGINIFLRGKFWNLGSDGHSIIVQNGRTERGMIGNGGAIQNLWLGR